MKQALAFAKQVIELADEDSAYVGTYQCFYEKKNEYVGIRKS